MFFIKKHLSMILIAMAVCLGLLIGFTNIGPIMSVTTMISEIFIRLFKAICMPVICLSIISALISFKSTKVELGVIWKKTIFYTLSTTIVAASMAALAFLIVQPDDVHVNTDHIDTPVVSESYSKFLVEIMPDNIFMAFAENKVLSILLVSFTLGFGIRYLGETDQGKALTNIIEGLAKICYAVVKVVVIIMPLGIMAFIAVAVHEFSAGLDFAGMLTFFLLIIGCNIFQAMVILPIFLGIQKINPLNHFKNMLPALTVAFFSKSSSATLPVTIDAAENRAKISKKVSRFVLPICTTINMNGCAAFIFLTVIYLMKNAHLEISWVTIVSWIIIATITAIGNAGVPMGCFFLSASLLSSMNVPIILMGVILPFYTVVDMLETSVNVWSDSCVAVIVNKRLKETMTKKSRLKALNESNGLVE